MSLIIIIRRPGLTVVGADRLASWIADRPSEEPEYTEHTKVGVHPVLPIAWAIWGIASLDGRDTTTVIGEMIEDIPENIWTAPGVGSGIVRLRLEPLIVERRQGAPEPYRPRVQVEFAVAIGLGKMRVEINGEDGTKYVAHAFVKPTPSLDGFFAGGPESEEARYGRSDESEVETVARVKRMLEQGMAEEAKRQSGTPLKCGLGGDIVVVDKMSARFVEHFKTPL